MAPVLISIKISEAVKSKILASLFMPQNVLNSLLHMESALASIEVLYGFDHPKVYTKLIFTEESLAAVNLPNGFYAT